MRSAGPLSAVTHEVVQALEQQDGHAPFAVLGAEELEDMCEAAMRSAANMMDGLAPWPGDQRRNGRDVNMSDARVDRGEEGAVEPSAPSAAVIDRSARLLRCEIPAN